MAGTASSTHRWWKEAVVYQIYPASFASTGSGSFPGWGDIRGITAKLDYLKDLGVDVVWTSPIFTSPQIDMGYDIADYKDIDHRYGTLSDVDELIRGLKERDMKFMVDLVVNHSSDQHAWFLDSRSSRDSKYRDWYHWQPAKYDEAGNRVPPNNWGMILGEAHSAWTWDEKTQEYYLALFTPEQPDLNWENPDVRAAVHEILQFWLERGASGFRMDVINHISKVSGYPDGEVTNPHAKYQSGDKYYANGPRLHEFLQEIHKKVLSKFDTITVGEMPYVQDNEEILRAIGEDRNELNMIFIFEHVNIDNAPGEFRFSLHDWKPKDLRNIVSKWQTVINKGGGWNSVFIENHDNPRSISRYADDSDECRELSAKLLALMQTTLSGTLYVYQGEELGMRNIPSEWPIDEYKDIESINAWKKFRDLYADDEKKMKYAKRVMQRKARDHARTPVQWNDGPNAGFCAEGITPWMRVNDDYRTVNAAAQQKSQASGDLSVLQFWKRALMNRKAHKDVFVYGSYQVLDEDHPTVFAYRRASRDEAFVTVLNFSSQETVWDVPASIRMEKWVAGNYSAGAPEQGGHGKITLKPWEGILGMAKP